MFLRSTFVFEVYFCFWGLLLVVWGQVLVVWGQFGCFSVNRKMAKKLCFYKRRRIYYYYYYIYLLLCRKIRGGVYLHIWVYIHTRIYILETKLKIFKKIELITCLYHPYKSFLFLVFIIYGLWLKNIIASLFSMFHTLFNVFSWR